MTHGGLGRVETIEKKTGIVAKVNNAMTHVRCDWAGSN